jgi:tyrosyl-tRNA synthetase
MAFQYEFSKLKQAILFNTQEVLPTDEKQLDEEIQILVDQANSSGEPIRHYIGFEISGQLHFPGSVYQMLNVAKLQEAGVECVIWLADYHTKINKKLGGNIQVIRQVARTYFDPVLRKCVDVAGGDGQKLIVLYAEDEYYRKNENGNSFWDFEFEVDQNLTLKRVLRSLSVAGKEANESVDYQLTRYPGMQAADVFWLRTHIVQGGLDQRKIYAVSRDLADKVEDPFSLKINNKRIKPIILFNQLLLGLEPTKEKSDGEMTKAEVNKMSKSKPDSAIWVHDSFEEILRKLKKAYCPMPRPEEQAREEIEAEQEWNPLLDWSKKMIYPAGKKVELKRKPEWGGDKTYETFAQLQEDYFAGNLHPMDLKTAVAQCLADWFAPIKVFVDQNNEGLEILRGVGR